LIRPSAEGEGRSPRSFLTLAALGLLAAAMIAGLLALGVWQLERRVWKLGLIAQVEARIHAPASPAPGPAAWPDVTRDRDQYRHVRVTGVFLHDRETLTQAATAYGAGFWVLTPLRTDDGFTVLVNRGFVSPERRSLESRVAGQVQGRQTVEGLLRLTEPKGGFLRANEPAADRWRSRDVAAIAAARGLSGVAPYFIDADKTPNPGGWPIGGLTVVRFPNSHLVYALTWFALALMLACGAVFVARDEWRVRRGR
jgi:surfeit locus 1 family protein